VPEREHPHLAINGSFVSFSAKTWYLHREA